MLFHNPRFRVQLLNGYGRVGRAFRRHDQPASFVESGGFHPWDIAVKPQLTGAGENVQSERMEAILKLEGAKIADTIEGFASNQIREWCTLCDAFNDWERSKILFNTMSKSEADAILNEVFPE